MSHSTSTEEVIRDERETTHHCASIIVVGKRSPNQPDPLTWAEYYVRVEYAFKQLEMSDVVQLVRVLLNTDHRSAQRCQHASLKNTLPISSTITASFEQSGCTFAMPRPAVLTSYERLRDKSFISKIKAPMRFTYLTYQRQHYGTKCFR